MSDVEIARDDIDKIVLKIKAYFNDELDQSIGGFEAEFLLDFFAKEMGPYFYNQGLNDAHSLFMDKNEELGYLIQELEKPIER